MKALIFASLVGLALAAPARTETVTEALFAEGVFASLPDGQEVGYIHVRRGAVSPDGAPVTDGRIAIVSGPAADGTPTLSLSLETEEGQRQTAHFPASGGNPVLMVFLESAVRRMAAASGGSPFYIRNRIKDALREGGEMTDGTQDLSGQAIATREVVLYPFKSDPNRDRMGEFADLSLRFVVSDKVPGHFLLLSADTPKAASGYHETITLIGAEEGQ
jgi:hypothetical protein